MAFTEFKNLGQVVKKYDLLVKNLHFLPAEATMEASEWLHQEIKCVFEQGLYRTSEIAIGEQLIYPVLKEVWKNHFLAEFLLWSHPTFSVDEQLTGTPDYLVAKRTRYDNALVGPPILVTIEAKKDNFEEGWGQCAAEMVAAKVTNGPEFQQKIYGIVSNGDKWEFAYLHDNTFVKNIAFVDVLDLNKLYSSLYYILQDSKN